jgi:PelA/Pel-15E family pectate lyase
MEIEQPSPAVRAAVEAAVAWFEAAKLTGIRQENRPDSSLPRGVDRVIVPDPAAPPLWARFYEIGANRPIFSGRDGIIKYRLADIEHEHRTGYAWYTTAPAALLSKEYPAWKARASER